MAAAGKQLVLPEGALGGTDARVFPGFPGVWMPGVPVDCSTLGLTVSDAEAQVKELGLPLTFTSKAAAAAEAEPKE